MKRIEQNEIYEHLSQFLKNRGVDMKEGSYTRRIQKGCSLLTDAVNLTQQGMEKAKTEIDKRLEQMRQVIHEKTAPKASAGQPPPAQNKTAPIPTTTPNAQAGKKQSGKRSKPASKSGRKK